MRIRLDPADDLLHPVEAASNFNESRYYNFAGAGLGGWVRMRNLVGSGLVEYIDQVVDGTPVGIAEAS